MERHQLSKNFFLDEFTFSPEAARRGKEIPLALGSPVYLAIKFLCAELLQPLRDALGPVTITSGYRPPWLNRLIGGSPSSQHCFGLAADFKVHGYTPFQVCEAIAASGREFDQLIHEFGRWTHLSISPDGQYRNQQFTAWRPAAKVLYEPGIHEIETLLAAA